MIDEVEPKLIPGHLGEIIPKCAFETKKTGQDGLVLQVHHTLPEASGKTHSHRFTSASFNLLGERLSVSDSSGNVFIIDFLSNKFWMLPKQPFCNFVTFSQYPPKKQDVLVGSISGPLLFVNCDTGQVTGELTGHKSSPVSVSFGEDEPLCLTVGSGSAVIWDLRSMTLLHQLTLRSSIAIKQVKFMPVSNNILGLFEDNSVHVWKLETLECTKQIFPDDWGGPDIRAIAITRNGRGMVVGGHAGTLAVFLLDNWSLQKLIVLPENCKGVKHLEFIPQLFDGGANKVLGVVTSSCSVIFVDTETSVLLKTVNHIEGCVSKLEVSPSGKYVALVMLSGEVNIYNSQLLTGGQPHTLVAESISQTRSKNRIKREANIPQQVSSVLDLSRLQPILKEFGEYPEAYRSLIWKSVLSLPENQNAYVALINKGVHPAFSTLDKLFPLNDRSLASSLKRLLSCLAYWSPVFVQVKYLPIFVLPFVKLMRHDQFTCFEAVATILVNWCQGWFEFVPYPPVTVLETVKNLLQLYDNQLLSHFNQNQVTPDLFIWSLLETAFSEVLGNREWLQLFDHILSNHPAFLLFTVVSFNITCRSLLLNLQKVEHFQQFYHTEVVVNMKQLINKTYQLWSKTAPDDHPKHTLRPFKSLAPGNMYQMFTDYPKHLLDNQLERLSTFFGEKSALETQKTEVNIQKQNYDTEKKLLDQSKSRDSRLKKLEGVYKSALKKEEGHLEEQRRDVSAARRSLREQEAVIRSQAVEKTLQDKADKYAQLERLVEKIERKRGGSDLQSSVLSSCYQSSSPTSNLRLQHASVVHHISKLKRLCRQNVLCPELRYCIGKFEDLMERIENALDREQNSHDQSPRSEQIFGLEDETRALEDEALQLLKKLSSPELPKHHCSSWSKGSKATCYCCGDSEKV